MKRSLYALAVALTAITVGCRESDVFGPAGNPALESGGIAKSASASNIIVLSLTMVDERTDGEYAVSGQVRYALTQRPDMSRELFDVSLETEASVTTAVLGRGAWKVGDASSALVDLTNQRTGVVDRWYHLQGGPDGRALHIRFEVTATTVSAASVTVE